MYFWILQPWNCKSVNPFFTTLVWRKEKGVCINFTKIASNEVVTQKFDCHQQLSSTKVCLWKKWTMFFTFVLLSCWWRSNFRVTISFDVIFMNFFLFRLSASSAISIWFSRGNPNKSRVRTSFFSSERKKPIPNHHYQILHYDTDHNNFHCTITMYFISLYNPTQNNASLQKNGQILKCMYHACFVGISKFISRK